MSTRGATLEAPADGRVDLVALGAPLAPQVNLLPPEIRAKRTLGRVKVWLGITLLVVLLVALLAFVFALLQERSAAAELAEKEDQVARLQAEQATYAEVPRIKNQISAVEDSLVTTMRTEILWADHIEALRAVTPPGVRLDVMTTTTPGPTTLETPSSNPLDGPSVGSISFTAFAATLPDLATWMEQLDAIPGLQDATYTTAEIQDQEGVASYQISAVVQVGADAYAERYVEETE